MASHQQTTAVYLAAFFDELVSCGVRDVVVSPGSRSTGLAMTAYELSCREPESLRVHVDVDERGAAFLGLGLAKATGRPVALVCTSGTAVAHYLPALIEAETSRVPLVALTGDRPLRLQGLGAPQTTDQVKVFGDHVRLFRQMPEPRADEAALAYGRQMAREACMAALGPGAPIPPRDVAGEALVASVGCERLAGPVHLNFPLDEPLKPDFAGCAAAGVGNPFAAGRREGLAEGDPCAEASCAQDAASGGRFGVLGCNAALAPAALGELAALLSQGPALVFAGEGTAATATQAEEVLRWAESLALPLVADPLSGLRSFDSPCVMDGYDGYVGAEDVLGRLMPQTLIRFGRYPVSKKATQAAAAWQKAGCVHVVVDVAETRDFNSATDMVVPCTPQDFIGQPWQCVPSDRQRSYLRSWQQLDAQAGVAAAAVEEADGLHEGKAIRAVLEEIPEGTALVCANSMAIRAIDTFWEKGAKRVLAVGNRGQNGIDGMVSTAVGVALARGRATFITGDLTLLHDINGLALQREMLREDPAPSLAIVLLNNNGGAIFDMLPQRSDEAYFERLFLAPQDVDFASVAAGFAVPYEKVGSKEALEVAYRQAMGRPGISLIEVPTALRGVTERYRPYQGCR